MASRVEGYKLEKLKVDSLLYDLKNPRFKGLGSGANSQASVEKLVQNVHGIDELEESISKIGVVEPLYAVQEDSKYRVIEGNQRLFVLRQLQKKKVTPPAGVGWDAISTFVIPKDTSELEILRIQAVLQQTKKDWPPEGEAAHYFEMVRDEEGDSEEERMRRVAETVKVSLGYIRKRIEAWKEWKSYVKEMELPPEAAKDKFSYFFEMKKKTKAWFRNSPDSKKAYYNFITATRSTDQKIRTVKKEDNLDDFEKIVDKPHIVDKLKEEPDYTLADAVADAETEDPKLALKGLRLARTLADSLSRASKEQVKLIKLDKKIYPHIRRLYDVIQRRFLEK